MNNDYIDYKDCPHCFEEYPDQTGGESKGCEKCGQTGTRVLKKSDYSMFASAYTFYKDRIEDVFYYWHQHLQESKESWGVDSFDIDWDGEITVHVSSYRGCGEYDRKSVRLPEKYLIAENHNGDYKKMIDEEVAAREVERAVQKATEDAAKLELQKKEDAEKAEKQREHDQAEYERLKKIFE